jgi:hypothetical protein
LKICGELLQTCPAKPQNGAVAVDLSFVQALRFARVHPHPLILSSSNRVVDVWEGSENCE